MGLSGLGLAVWLVACSSDSTGAGASTPEGACDQLVNAICSKLNECAPLLVRLSYKDVNDCVARQKDQCVKSANAPSSGATPSAVSACASAYSSATCDTVFGPLDACKTPAGQLADGAPCGDGAQCAGRRCNTTAGSQCGACTTKAGAGANCDSSSDCDESLRCAQNGKCVAPSKAGAPCGETQPCVAPLVCSKGTCATGAGAGASCANGETCDAVKGLFCESQSKVCKELKLAKAGETCGFVDGTIVGCEAAGKCKVTTGQMTGTCQAAVADGAACTADGPDCQAPADCVNGVCTIPDPLACK